MEYFCLPEKRQGTCSHEFFRGKWDKLDYWNVTSLLLHDDMMQQTNLYEAFDKVLSNYKFWGETEITLNDWDLVCEYTKDCLGENAQKAIFEIKHWTDDVFAKEGLFTILGI